MKARAWIVLGAALLVAAPATAVPRMVLVENFTNSG